MAKPKNKTKHKTLRALRNDVAGEVQKMVRLKAADENGYCTCVTCGNVCHWKKCDGGHFIKRGFQIHMLTEENIHVQCKGCNGFQDGNLVAYTLFMQEMYGMEFVEELERTKHDKCTLIRPDLEDMLIDLRARNRVLEAAV